MALYISTYWQGFIEEIYYKNWERKYSKEKHMIEDIFMPRYRVIAGWLCNLTLETLLWSLLKKKEFPEYYNSKIIDQQL